MISPRSLVRMAPPRAVRGICTTAPPSKPPPEPLSPSELDAVSALLPRLLSADHVPAAGRLLSAALLLPGSLERLPLPSLAAHLASLPTLSPAFALLTALRHHPARPSPLPLAAPLLDSLLSLRRARDAASVLRWLCRPDSPRRPDAATYAAAVAGFCRLEDAKSALAALREMSADGVKASRELREAVRDAMLQDARIEEAWALEEAMRRSESGNVVELADKLLVEWEP
jgi:pentatricopeptide repeat protein